MGCTLEVDPHTHLTVNLQFGRVKILLGGSRKLPTTLSLWHAEFESSVMVEEEASLLSPPSGPFLSCRIGGAKEDNNVGRKNSNFKSPSSEEEFELMFLGLGVVGHSEAQLNELDTSGVLGLDDRASSVFKSGSD